MTQEIRVVISGDSTKAEQALDRVDAALGQLGAQAARPLGGAGGNQGLGRLGNDIRGVGDQSRYAREQMRNLSYQMTDIVTGLATGQNPFYVLLQQGGQLRDVFGGVLPALRAVASVFTIARVAAGGLAGAIASVGIAFIAGARESEQLNQALAATGDAAQVTSTQYEKSVQQIADDSRIAVGSVRDVAEAMLSAGVRSAQSFEPSVRAAALFAKATGKSAEDVSKEFADMSKDVTAWTTTFTKSYNIVTAAQLDEIRALQAQGRQQEAVKLAAEAVATAFEGRVVPSQYAVVRGWNSLTKALSEYWDTLKGFARDETPEERLESLLKKQQARDKARAAGASPDAGQFRDEARERAQIRALQNLTGASRRAREQLADVQAGENRKIENDSDQSQQALAAIDRAGIERRLAIQQSGLDRARAAYELAFQQDLVDAQGYQAALLEIDLGGLRAREQALREQQRLESARKPSNVNETRAQQAALLQIETELLRIESERAKLRESEARGERDIIPKARTVGPRDDLRRFENAERAAEQAVTEQQRGAALQAANNLVAINKQLSVELITDAETRSRALLVLEEDQLRKSIDLAALSDDARRAAIEDLATWRLNREKQITQQFKPLYQQQLDDWRDMKRLQREADEEMWGGILRNSEDAWVTLVTTGKLSIGALVRDFIAAQARLDFRKFVGGQGGSILGSLFTFGGNIIKGATDTVTSLLGGGRAYGGDVHRGMLHPINERGVPEVVSVKGRDYLATGASSGRVTPMRPTGAVINAPINQTLYIDSRTDSAQVAQIAVAAVEQGQAAMMDNLRATGVIR